MGSLKNIKIENYVCDKQEQIKFELFKYIFEHTDHALEKIRALYLDPGFANEFIQEANASLEPIQDLASFQKFLLDCERELSNT